MGQVRPIAPHLRGLNAPEPLRALPGWLIWRYETHSGEPKPRKVPYYVSGTRRHGQQGSPQDRAQLTTFAAARDAAMRLGFDGVGLAMLPEWGITAIDVDHCVDPDGNVPEDIEGIVQQTYAEYSPSGAGILLHRQPRQPQEPSHARALRPRDVRLHGLRDLHRQHPAARRHPRLRGQGGSPLGRVG